MQTSTSIKLAMTVRYTLYIGLFFTMVFALLSVLPASAEAATKKTSNATPFEVSGWIPYWRTEAGTADVIPHLNQLAEVNPFGYTVKNDGTVFNVLKIEGASWQKLIASAKAKKVRIIPTVMWSDTATIDTILRDSKSRAKHIASITDMVKKNNFDGVDIDYEGKKAETREYFSLFLKELSVELKKDKKNPKMLNCTIEARMPLSARYSGAIPSGIEYANDLPIINKYCDRIRIMTYDQQTADVQLNKTNKGKLYVPVADTAWVQKVIEYMAEDIDKKKMSIGVATYGYVYQVMPSTDGTSYSYDKLEAFNPRYAIDTAKEYGITPTRNTAGEMSFSYVPRETSSKLPSQSILAGLAPKGTASANLAAAGALARAKSTQKQSPFYLLTWSDAGAIKEKVILAKKLGVRGVAVFKFDGGEDPAMWSVLK